MKFHLVPIGEKFEYQGEIYIKADKLIANSAKTGQNRLIPRSANVQPVGTQPDTTPKVVEEHQVQTAKVLAQFDSYHQQVLQCIDDEEKLTELEAARQRFIDNLIS